MIKHNRKGILHKKDGTGHLPDQFIVAATKQNMFQVSFLTGKHDELCYICGKIINECLVIRDLISLLVYRLYITLLFENHNLFSLGFYPEYLLALLFTLRDIFFS